MEEANSTPKRGDGKRQVFRIGILKKEQSAALEILNKCPQTLRGDLVATAVVYYDEQMIRQPADGSDRPRQAEEKPVDAQAKTGRKLTDLFNNVQF